MVVVAAWGGVSRPFVFAHRDHIYLFLPDAPTWDTAKTAVESILAEPGLRVLDAQAIRRLAKDAWEDQDRVSVMTVTSLV